LSGFIYTLQVFSL